MDDNYCFTLHYSEALPLFHISLFIFSKGDELIVTFGPCYLSQCVTTEARETAKTHPSGQMPTLQAQDQRGTALIQHTL